MTSNYPLFKNWDIEKLKKFCSTSRERVLKKDEILFKDGMKGDNLYILLQGSLRLQKEVLVHKDNYWPTTHKTWESTSVENRVLYTI